MANPVFEDALYAQPELPAEPVGADPPPPPGVVWEETKGQKIDKSVVGAASGLGSGVSRLAGVLVGTINAPLAFIKGAMNAPSHNPEEWAKIPAVAKPFVNLVGGLESAWRSASQPGDWGEQYDQYYTSKTGSTLEKDFGPTGANVIRVGLDVMMDPMVGPMLAYDMSKLGINTVGQFAKYVRTGGTPIGAKEVRKFTAADVEDFAKLNALDAAEVQTIKANLVNTLKNRAKAMERESSIKADQAAASYYSGYEPQIYPYVSEAEEAGYGFRRAAPQPYVASMGFDDASRQIADEFLGENRVVEAIKNELARQNPFEGKTPKISLDDLNPELAEKARQFFARGNTSMRAAAPLAGVSIDEDGNISFDAEMGAMGLAAVIGAQKFTPNSFTNIAAGFGKQSSKRVAEMYGKTLQSAIDRERTTFGKLKALFTRTVVDTSGNIKADLKSIDPIFGKEVEITLDLVAGARNNASAMNQKYMDEIYRGLPQEDYHLLNSVINSRRTIEIDDIKGIGVIKHSDGLTGVEHLDYLDDLEKRIGGQRFSDLMARSDRYFDAMREQLDMQHSEGLIGDAAYDAIRDLIYSPRRFIQHLDDHFERISGSKLSVSEKSVMKKLDEGSENLMEIRGDLLLSRVTNSTQEMIFRNRANRALLDFAEANPGNGIVELSKIKSYTKDGKPIYQDTPGGFEKIKVMVGGEEKEMLMPSHYAAEWVKSDPLVNQSMASAIRWLSGSNIVKAFATGYNPAFAMANMARDIAHVWMTTSQYSKHAPIAMGEMAHDFAVVATDVFKRKGRVSDYIKEGGGMEFQTYYGRFSGQGEIGEKVNSIGKLLGWVGETSELWTRMALRERAIRNGKSARDATWEARHYLDFAQGGSFVKALDTGLPYLNAGIQATRGIFRAAKMNPAEFTYKMAQVGTISAGLYLANYLTNPEALKEVSDRDRVANFVVTTPYSYVDSEGTTRHVFIKIPKDQAQRAIASAFEAAMARIVEGKIPTKQVLQAIGDFANSSFVPPTISAALAYMANVDTWTNDNIWKGAEVLPQEEYGAETSPLSVGIGKVFVASPERIERAFGKVAPLNNFFVGMVGGGLRAITNAMTPEKERKMMHEMLLSNASIRRFVSQTSPMNRYRDELKEIKTEETTRRFIMSRELDKLTEAYFKGRDNESYAKIESYISAQDPEDQERLINRANMHAQVAQLPDKYWWVSTGSMAPRARAIAFQRRWNDESAFTRARMLEIANSLSGFASEDFIAEIETLMGK